jgi:predicted dehydrogenase
MYKCAIIGVGGGRAKGHAEAYRHIQRGQLAAISTRRADKLEEFGAAFGVAVHYTDYREMLHKERPDLVHVNTPPDVRLEVFQAAEAAGVPALIVEKPLAIQGEDYREIVQFARSAKIKIAVNHQLHFHPRRLLLQQAVRQGKIGEIRFIDATCGMNLACQGTHILQAISAFNPFGVPNAVFGQVAGAEGLEDTPRQHLAPDQCTASIDFDNGVQAQMRCGTNAPEVGDGPVNSHKRITVYGSEGFAQWTMHGWELRTQGRTESGSHIYSEEDILGQAAMIEAMFNWLADEAAEHPLNLESSLIDFNVVLGLYTSALLHEQIALPMAPAADLIKLLRWQLGGMAEED